VLNEVTDVADFLNLLYLKLSPWFKIKILTVTPWSVSFSIGEFDELFAMNDSGWKLQTASNKPGTRGAASRHFANHLNGILSGSVRDDAGNLTARDISVFREDARRRPIEVVRTIPEGFRLLSYEPRMSSDCYWSLGCKDWVLIGDRVEAANRDMWPAIRFVAEKTMREASKTLKSSDAHETDFGNMPNHIGDANKKVDPLPSEEKPKDRTVFEVGDPVVTFNGRRGSIEAFGLIEDFPITVRHSKRETASYRLGDVRLDTDAKSVVKESLTAEPEPAPKKYRTPTILDLSNGPIRCEVFDDEDEVWTKRWLTFVSDLRAFPFVTVDPENKDKSGSWKRCRIEVAVEPVPGPVIKQSLTTESNCPEIPDGSKPSVAQHFRWWKEVSLIMAELLDSGLSAEDIKRELLLRLPEGPSSK
jgi:hypothetical protein